METIAMVEKSTRKKLIQLLLPGLSAPTMPKDISIRFLPSSPYYTMLAYLSRGYGLSPLEYVKWSIRNSFEFYLEKWGVNYERKD